MLLVEWRWWVVVMDDFDGVAVVGGGGSCGGCAGSSDVVVEVLVVVGWWWQWWWRRLHWQTSGLPEISVSASVSVSETSSSAISPKHVRTSTIRMVLALGLRTMLDSLDSLLGPLAYVRARPIRNAWGSRIAHRRPAGDPFCATQICRKRTVLLLEDPFEQVKRCF